MIYSINYDLKRPGQNYNELYDAIKGCGAWCHFLDSHWLVDTNLSASNIWARLKPHVDANDLFFISGVTKDYSGWLPLEAWDWINSRQNKMAA